MKKSIILGIIILLCASLLAGCAKKPPQVPQASVVYKEGGRGVVSFAVTHFDTFNPVLTQSDSVLEVMTLVYDSLYRRGADGKMEAVLVTDREISSDALTYTLHLRGDVKWHDGSAFSAYDLAYTLASIEAAPESKLRYCLSGIESHRLVDAHTYEFTLLSPNSCFTEQLNFPIVKQGTDCTQVSSLYTPMGTGAYKYVPAEMNRAYVFRKNSDCVTSKLGAVEEMIVKVIPEASNLMYALESREIEAVHVDTQKLRTYSPKGNVATFAYTNRQFLFLGICAEGELADKKVRHALSLLIDREALKKNALFGRFSVATLPFADGAWQPAALTETAADLLTAAGYAKSSNGLWTKQTEEGAEPLKVSVLVNEDNAVRCGAAEEIVKQLCNAGIKASVEKVDFETYKQRIAAQEYELFLGETVLETDLSVSAFVGSGALYSAVATPEMDALLQSARDAATQADKEKAFYALGESIVDVMPVISLGFGQNALVVNDRISGEITPVYGNLYCNFAAWSAK